MRTDSKLKLFKILVLRTQKRISLQNSRTLEIDRLICKKKATKIKCNESIIFCIRHYTCSYECHIPLHHLTVSECERQREKEDKESWKKRETEIITTEHRNWQQLCLLKNKSSNKQQVTDKFFYYIRKAL